MLGCRSRTVRRRDALFIGGANGETHSIPPQDIPGGASANCNFARIITTAADTLNANKVNDEGIAELGQQDTPLLWQRLADLSRSTRSWREP